MRGAIGRMPLMPDAADNPTCSTSSEVGRCVVANETGPATASQARRYRLILIAVALLVVVAIATLVLPDRSPSGGNQPIPSSSIVDPPTVPSGSPSAAPSS